MTYSQLHIALHHLVKVRSWAMFQEHLNEEETKKRIEYWDDKVVTTERIIAEVRRKRQQESDMLTIQLLSN